MLENVLDFILKGNELDLIIEETKSKMLSLNPLSKEYQAQVGIMNQLLDLKKQEKDLKAGNITKQDLLNAALGLTGISMVLGFEKTDVITSKLFGVATRFLGK